MMHRRHVLGIAAALVVARPPIVRAEGEDAMTAALFHDPDTPILGNPNGDVAVVEFFDYRCPYCRRSAADLDTLAAEDSGVRLVMKEWPILGAKSVEAARGALAAHLQGQYAAVHWRLMQGEVQAGRDGLSELARDLGLDMARYEADRDSDRVTAMLARNDELASALGLTGTPGFVVGQAVIPGAVSLDTLRDLVAKARSEV